MGSDGLNQILTGSYLSSRVWRRLVPPKTHDFLDFFLGQDSLIALATTSLNKDGATSLSYFRLSTNTSNAY